MFPLCYYNMQGKMICKLEPYTNPPTNTQQHQQNKSENVVVINGHTYIKKSQ